MFRGFISECGVVAENGAGGFTVAAAATAAGLAAGGSVGVAGVCLSAREVGDGRFTVSLSGETARRSTLDGLAAGARVNVELPIRAGDAIEGHLVQGHVDAVGKVLRIDEEPGGAAGRRVWIRPPERFLESVTAKGSVAVDGVSLTVAEVVRDRFAVALVPSTLERTTLAELMDGSRVNLESDLVDKLARRHEGRAAAALRRAIAAMPWAGHVTGRTGVEKVVAQIAAGGCVVVWDPDREGEGDVIVAGASLAPATMAFILTQACSHPTVPCDRARLDRLEIPPMAGTGDRHGTAMHVSVDLAAARGTGVSAEERAATIRRLAHSHARPGDFLRPGHVFPLGARDGGLRERAGHTEATVELCRAAKLPAVGVCCEIMNPDGVMAGAAEVERFALHWQLPMVEIADLRAWL
jgi:3,4-dihydroxy 2-butanone 4-phosphate synthase/3,4-dihydroxy 2-butanone 4-phosphate synthase/GTP cyclohydrolase II